MLKRYAQWSWRHDNGTRVNFGDYANVAIEEAYLRYRESAFAKPGSGAAARAGTNAVFRSKTGERIILFTHMRMEDVRKKKRWAVRRITNAEYVCCCCWEAG